MKSKKIVVAITFDGVFIKNKNIRKKVKEMIIFLMRYAPKEFDGAQVSVVVEAESNPGEEEDA